MSLLTFSTSRGIALAMATFSLVIFNGCAERDTALEAAEGKVIVMSTILPLSDWAQQVGGDRVYVHTLLPAGASPHTFDPSPRDMRLISKAKLLLKVGLHMDDWGANLAKAAGKDAPKMISLGDRLNKLDKLPDVSKFDSDTQQIVPAGAAHHHDHDDHGHDHDHDHHHHHGGVNPHFWSNPELAIASVEIIRDALTNVDPEGRAIYEGNAARYIEELKALDNEIAQGLSPYKGRSFVSFHNAWPYLAEQYGLSIAAVIEEYAGKSPGEKYLREVTDRVRELGIKTIFSEPQLNPRVAEVLAQEVGATVGVLDPYGTAGVEGRDTYVETMRYNLAQLQKAFAAEE